MLSFILSFLLSLNPNKKVKLKKKIHSVKAWPTKGVFGLGENRRGWNEKWSENIFYCLDVEVKMGEDEKLDWKHW